MLYCESCEVLYTDDITKCKECDGELRSIKENDMVLLIQTSIEKSNIICDKFIENQIEWKGRMLPINEDGSQETELYVEYKDYKKATELVKNIEFTELSPRKRSFLKILSIIILIMVVCAIVWGIDSIAYMLRNLYMRS